ncbi:MAG: amidase, partial [Rhizobiales bacterium]|nr:amidase [Hyphomicrobiales bacterium]
MKALHWLTASEVRAAYRSRSLSPVELVDALLDHVERHDPRINAFIRLDAEKVRAEARCAEAEIRAEGSRGPLHGIPVAIKDNIDVAGEVTTCHSKLMLDNVATSDAAIVSRLRAQGAILFGKVA